MDQLAWKAPFVVAEHDRVAQGLLRRAENFLRALLEPASTDRPLSYLKDLEEYLGSLPRQGTYFAGAVRKLVAPPYRGATLRASVIGAGVDYEAQTREHERAEAKADVDWHEQWRQKVLPAVSKYWGLIEEAVSLNQKG